MVGIASRSPSLGERFRQQRDKDTYQSLFTRVGLVMSKSPFVFHEHLALFQSVFAQLDLFDNDTLQKRQEQRKNSPLVTPQSHNIANSDPYNAYSSGTLRLLISITIRPARFVVSLSGLVKMTRILTTVKTMALS